MACAPLSSLRHLQLNDPDEFTGGGTLFEHAGGCPISVQPGEALIFCGYNPHAGVEVTRGTRFILTGFVDYRAPFEDLRHFDNGKVPYSKWTDFPNPSLSYNVQYLSERYDGARGVALLRHIANAPQHVPNLDCTELGVFCAAWLETRRRRADQPRLQRFVDVVMSSQEGQR